MPLAPGDRVIDFSGLRLNDTTVKQFTDAGGKGFIRYSAGVASDPANPNYDKTKWKLITPVEFAFLQDHGDIIANDEWYESRVTEGFAAGHADGLAALRLWQSCGLAKGAVIYSSWDQFPARSNWLKVRAYEKGFRSALNGIYDVDAYAGTGFLRWAIRNSIIKFGWRPNAGSWSNDGLPYQPDTSTPEKRAALVKLALSKTPAHVWQTGNYWFDKQADENLILRVPVGSHREALAASQSSVRISRIQARVAKVRARLALLRKRLRKARSK